MIRTRIVPLALTAAATAMALTACSADGGDTEASSAASTAASAVDTSLTDVQEAGVLVVGTEGTYRPFTFHDEGSGDLTGYDVDVITAVADKLGVDVQFEETAWDAIFAGLEAGRFDVIANQVGISPERQEKYTFSTPYTYSTGVVVVKAGNDDIHSYEDLAGKTAAQSLTSNYGEEAKAAGATIEAVDGWAQSIALVEQGRVDATINDKLTFLDYVNSTGSDAVKVAAEGADVAESALAFRGGSDALAAAASDALAELAADGTLAELSQKYFGADVSVAS
ncbi:transporter substrate-binding domain-containing protein [Demequina soli]|uniref:transporter substrate-binding domain-containing protein n=1 Tax=Demequina soli TaxID=1638987 RepID=UPI0007837FCC|nr:transporter substrate-binding domain-containing protein [Demequina soli]